MYKLFRMSDFHSLTVAQIEPTTEDCSVVTFEMPREKQSDFQFVQGQYITLKSEIDGEEVRRSYSLCSSPLDHIWSVAIKKIEGGLFSTYINQKLKTGDVLEVMQPSGSFFVPTDASQTRNYVAFAAGSGITPMLSIIKTHLATESKSTFKLFYLNSTSRSIILKEEIEALKNQYLGRFQVCYFLSRERRDIELLNGRFTPKKIQQLAQTIIDVEQTDHVFLCGPKEMIFMIRDEFMAMGLPKERIHFELFFTGEADEETQKRASQVLKKRAVGTEITLIDGGKEFLYTMEKYHDSILDAALQAGADLPFACKGGVCSTCKCKVLDGSVEMKINYALEEEEVAANFVLSCQAVPTTKKVTVDFDV